MFVQCSGVGTLIHQTEPLCSATVKTLWSSVTGLARRGTSRVAMVSGSEWSATVPNLVWKFHCFVTLIHYHLLSSSSSPCKRFVIVYCSFWFSSCTSPSLLSSPCLAFLLFRSQFPLLFFCNTMPASLLVEQRKMIFYNNTIRSNNIVLRILRSLHRNEAPKLSSPGHSSSIDIKRVVWSSFVRVLTI